MNAIEGQSKQHFLTFRNMQTPTTDGEGREIFKSVTPDMVVAAYSPLVTNPLVLQEIVAGNIQTDNPSDLSHLNRIGEKAPDVVALYKIISRFTGSSLIQEVPDIFRKLIGTRVTPTEKLIQGNDSVAERIDSGTRDLALFCLLTAFTPASQRHKLQTANRSSRELILLRITAQLPDLTQRVTETERLDAFLGVIDPSVSRAMKRFYGDEMTPSAMIELKKNNPLAYDEVIANLHQFVGSNTLYGILTDHKHNGDDNLFRGPANKRGTHTEHGQCPATSFVFTWFDGVSQAMSNAKEQIIAAISA